MTKKHFIFLGLTLILAVIGLFLIFFSPKKNVDPYANVPVASLPPGASFVPVGQDSSSLGGVSEQFKNDEAEFIKETPILQKLPADNAYFSIEYVDEAHLIVHAQTINPQIGFDEAKTWFAKNNIDISQVLVEYKNR